MKISKMNGFKSPIIELEQYTTQGSLAARWIRLAKDMGDMQTGCTVADLGCGTGVLGLGALFCGASAAALPRAGALMLGADEDTVLFVLPRGARANPLRWYRRSHRALKA